MKSLVESLVERSLRGPLREPAPTRSADAMEQGNAGPAGSSTLPPGLIRPRHRSRHEPRPGSTRPEVEMIEDLIGGWPLRAPDAQDQAAPSLQQDREAKAAPASRGVPSLSRMRSAGRAISPSARRLESGPQPRPPAEAEAPPAAPPISASVPPASPRHDRQVLPVQPRSAVHTPPATPRPDHHFDPVTSAGSSTTATELVDDATAPRPRGAPRPPAIIPIATPRAEPVMTAQLLPPGALERGAALRPMRDPARGADAPLRPATRQQPPPAPRVEITIGRVEVRAVYAPPPPVERKTSAKPMTSLDDYLKQRDKAG